jgi:hypothetical protein
VTSSGAQSAEFVDVELVAGHERHEVDAAALWPECAQADRPDHVEPVDPPRQGAVQVRQQVVHRRSRRAWK